MYNLHARSWGCCVWPRLCGREKRRRRSICLTRMDVADVITAIKVVLGAAAAAATTKVFVIGISTPTYYSPCQAAKSGLIYVPCVYAI